VGQRLSYVPVVDLTPAAAQSVEAAAAADARAPALVAVHGACAAHTAHAALALLLVVVLIVSVVLFVLGAGGLLTRAAGRAEVLTGGDAHATQSAHILGAFRAEPVTVPPGTTVVAPIDPRLRRLTVGAVGLSRRRGLAAPAALGIDSGLTEGDGYGAGHAGAGAGAGVHA